MDQPLGRLPGNGSGWYFPDDGRRLCHRFNPVELHDPQSSEKD